MTPADFKSMFPEFENTGALKIQAKLDLATPHFNVNRWGDLYNEGLGNFVAHHLVSAPATPQAGAADGATTEKQVGTVRVSRATELLKKQMDNEFLTTVYGRRYWALRMQVGIGVATS